MVEVGRERRGVGLVQLSWEVWEAAREDVVSMVLELLGDALLEQGERGDGLVSYCSDEIEDGSDFTTS